MTTPNTLPPLIWPSWKDERVLIIGIGGGADIISAYALGESLQPRPRELVYANTKTRTESDWLTTTPHIFTLPPAQTKKEGALKISSGGTALDKLLPRGLRGDPFICALEKGGEADLADELRQLGVTLILAVDTGGDVLARNGKRGRDQRMLAVLEQTEIPLWLMVLAPGADGQCKRETLEANLSAAIRDTRFRGSFSLQELCLVYRSFSSSLPTLRTPNLILQAFEAQEETMLIPRGCHPRIDVAWLRLGLAFEVFTAQTR